MSFRRVGLVAGLSLLLGCGDDVEVTVPPPTGAGGGATATGQGGAGGGFVTSSSTGTGGQDDPCLGESCPPDQHCEVVGGAAECVNNDCATLQCGPTEECQPTPGGGAICVDISCSEDVDC